MVIFANGALVYLQEAKRSQQNYFVRKMGARNLDIPCEAVLACPVCTKKAKIRNTKSHIEKEHKKGVTYECTVVTNGVKCVFSCSGRIGCFNNHQTRKHGQKFLAKAKHIYGPDTGFNLKLGEEVIKEHSDVCKAETKYYHGEQQKASRNRHRAKKAAQKVVISREEVALPSIKMSFKRKADDEWYV